MARVRPRSFAVLLFLLVPALSFCGGDSTGVDDDPDPQPDPDVAGEVDSSGGTVNAKEGKVTLVFPPGAVSDDTEITVKEAEASGDDGAVPGTEWDFGPDGLTFAEPVELTLRYDESALPERVEEEALAVYRQTDDGWKKMEGVSVDPAGNDVTALIESFSVYAVMVDPCVNAPSISLGETVSGELEASDCQVEGEKLQDQYTLTLDGTTAFVTTLEVEGYLPFVGTFVPGGRRLSGVTIGEGTRVSGLHIFPAGAYDVFVTSRESRESEDDPWPSGSYDLAVTPGSTDPGGCVPFIFLRSGMTVEGRLAQDDCQDPLDGEPDVVRYVDGYTVLVQAGETVTASVTADFPYRASLWNASQGELVEHEQDREPGSTTTLSATAGANAFYTLNPISENHEGTGTYSVTMEISGGSSAAPPPLAITLPPAPPRR